jgi:undecaprenyl diphosphate synthase
MKILIRSLKKELPTLLENNIKLNTMGITSVCSKELLDVINKTKDNTQMTLTLALSYGSREIVNAVKNICNKVKNNTISIDSIDDSIINEHLYTKFA